MNKQVDRRAILNATAAAGIATGVAAPVIAAENTDLARLNALMDAHAKAIEADTVTWRALGEIEDAMEDFPIVRVQVGRLFRGRDDEGNEIHDPIWACNESDIEKRYAQHCDAFLGLSGQNDTAKAKIKSDYDEIVQRKKDELAAIRAERKKRDDTCGFTDALAAARASSKNVKAIEAEIISLVPDSADVAALMAKWLIAAHANEFSYVDDEHLMPALSAIAKMSPKYRPPQIRAGAVAQHPDVELIALGEAFMAEFAKVVPLERESQRLMAEASAAARHEPGKMFPATALEAYSAALEKNGGAAIAERCDAQWEVVDTYPQRILAIEPQTLAGLAVWVNVLRCNMVSARDMHRNPGDLDLNERWVTEMAEKASQIAGRQLGRKGALFPTGREMAAGKPS